MDASYNNAAYQPNTPNDFSKPPSYPPQSPSPPPETTGNYPQQYPQQPPMMYPPPQSPPPPGYYPPQQYPQQTPMMYAPPGGQQQQPQQTTTVVFTAPPPVVVQQAPYVSYCGMIVFACLVFWFCNVLFGLIAFILAVVAENTKNSDAKGAQRLGKASMWLSIVGIVVTVVVIAIAVGVSVGTTAKAITDSRSYGTRQVIRSYISPSSCCSRYGYYYPGYGSSCYLSSTSTYSYASLASTCCSYGDSYYYTSSSNGYCYYYSYY